MTTFTDGPAKGKTLWLLRSPIFLRVVIDKDGTIDALDQLEDQPKHDEKIYVYQRVGKPGFVHLDRTVKGKRVGENYMTAEYRLFDIQPSDAEARSPKEWPDWCQAHVNKS